MHLLITLLFAIATAHRSEFRSTNVVTWAFTTAPTTLTEISPEISAFEITGTEAVDGDLTNVPTVNVLFTLNSAAVYDPEFVLIANISAAKKAGPGSNAPIVYEKTGVTPLTGLPLVGATQVHVWVVYEPTAANGAVQEKVATPLAVTPTTEPFTIDRANIAVNLVDYLTKITVTADGQTGNITAKIALQGDATKEPIVTGQIEETPTDEFVITLTAGQLTAAFGTLAVGKKLDIFISPKANGLFYTAKKTIDVVAGPTYSIATDEPVWSEFTLPFPIEVKGPTTSVRASNAWAGNWSFVVSKDPFLTSVVVANDFTKANQAPATGDKYIIEIDTTANGTLKVTGPTTLFVYAANAPSVDLTTVIPCVFKIKADPILFTVGDISINNDAEIPTLTITAADDSQGWHDTKIAAKLVWNSISILVNLTNGGSTNAAKTYTATGVDVSTWVEIPDQADVVIHAALTAESTIVYLPDTVTKKVTVDPVPPAADFNFLPAAISYEETSVVISAEPTTPTAWDAKTVKCIFTFVKTKPTTEPAGLTFPLVKATPPTGNPEPTVYDWNATVDMTKVTVPKDKTIIYAWIKLTDVVPPTSNAEEVLEEPFEITYTHAPKADFTVKPDKVDLRTDTKINVEVTKTATGAWVDDVYFHFAKAAVSAQPEDDKFVKAVKGTGKWTYELTLSTLTDLKKGDNIYVYVKHDVQTPAPTSNTKTGTFLEVPVLIPVDKTDAPPAAAMGVSPLLSLLAAALLLLVKLL